MVKKIPKKLNVGYKQYRVVRVKSYPGWQVGEINHRKKLLGVARYMRVLQTGAFSRMTTREQWETFWHETMHGILHDMKRHDLNNERFVNAFCRRLYQALDSR
jgi:hypothetical protein